MIEPPTKVAVTVRRAQPEDAAVLAAIHVAAWHETYTGLLPDDMIAVLTVAVRRTWWAQLLSNPPTALRGATYVAELDGAAVGFGTCNSQRSDVLAAAGFDGEISSFYVLRAAQGRGIGQALIVRMATRLQQAGYQASGTWVLRANTPGRRFMKGFGGIQIEGPQAVRGHGRFTEIAYGWRDLASLTAACDPGSRPD